MDVSVGYTSNPKYGQIRVHACAKVKMYINKSTYHVELSGYLFTDVADAPGDSGSGLSMFVTHVVLAGRCWKRGRFDGKQQYLLIDMRAC